MANPKLEPILGSLSRFVGDPDSDTRTDGELLAAFLSSQDQRAFARLMQRHAQLVWGICRRALGQEQEAEDAFQATFLVLARRAASIRKRQSLASWLHGVALHVTNHAKRAEGRRRERQTQSVIPGPAASADAELTWREARQILDEEINRLSARYREPFLLCCVENWSCAEVAQTLGLKTGTVWSRLARSKKKLQARLRERGLELATLLTAAAIGSRSANSAVRSSLLAATSRVACEVITGTSMASATIAPNVSALLKQTNSRLVVSRLSIYLVASLVVGLAAIGAGLGSHWSRVDPGASELVSDDEQEVQVPGQSQPPTRIDRFGDALPSGAVARIGTVRFRHGKQINDVLFAPDGNSLITTGHDGILHRWALADGKELTRIDLNELHVRQGFQPAPYMLGSDVPLSFSVAPGEEHVAVAGMNSEPRIWDLATGREKLALDRNIRADRVVQSHNGKILAYGMGRLVSGDDDPTITLVDAATGRELQKLKGPNSKIEQFDFTFDDRILVSRNASGEVRCWEAGANSQSKVINALAYALPPAGPHAALCQAGGTVGICDLGTGEVIQKLDGKLGAPPRLQFSPDGELLLGESGSKPELQIWNLKTKRRQVLEASLLLDRRGKPTIPTVSQFTPDGKAVLSGYSDGRILRRSSVTGKIEFDLKAHRSSVSHLAFSPDGKVLASCQLGSDTDSCSLKLWNAVTGQAWKPDQAAQGGIASLALASDGKTVAVATWDGTTRVADATTGQVLRVLPTFGPATFLPGSKKLLTGDRDRGQLQLWDLSTFTPEAFGTHPGYLSHLALAKNEKRLVSDGYRSMCIWDFSARKQLHKVEVASAIIGSSLSTDGEILATACQNGEVCLWDTRSGKVLWKRQNQDVAGGIAVSSDGTLVAWAGMVDHGRTYPVHVAEARTGKDLYTLSGDWAPGITCLLFSADNRLLFGGSSFSSRVFVWEVATGDQRTILSGHTGDVTCLATSADGATLASGSKDTSVLIWDLTGGHDVVAAAEELSETKLENQWNELGVKQAAAGYAAMRTLRQNPKKAIAYLSNKLKSMDAAQEAGSEKLRLGRVMELVEWIGDESAVQFLRQVAEKQPKTWLAAEAGRSLDRLKLREIHKTSR